MSVATLKCPTCGTEQVVDPERRGPDWFCANEGCDFPLSWREDTGGGALRR